MAKRPTIPRAQQSITHTKYPQPTTDPAQILVMSELPDLIRLSGFHAAPLFLPSGTQAPRVYHQPTFRASLAVRVCDSPKGFPFVTTTREHISGPAGSRNFSDSKQIFLVTAQIQSYLKKRQDRIRRRSDERSRLDWLKHSGLYTIEQISFAAGIILTL